MDRMTLLVAVVALVGCGVASAGTPTVTFIGRDGGPDLWNYTYRIEYDNGQVEQYSVPAAKDRYAREAAEEHARLVEKSLVGQPAFVRPSRPADPPMTPVPPCMDCASLAPADSAAPPPALPDRREPETRVGKRKRGRD